MALFEVCVIGFPQEEFSFQVGFVFLCNLNYQINILFVKNLQLCFVQELNLFLALNQNTIQKRKQIFLDDKLNLHFLVFVKYKFVVIMFFLMFELCLCTTVASSQQIYKLFQIEFAEFLLNLHQHSGQLIKIFHAFSQLKNFGIFFHQGHFLLLIPWASPQQVLRNIGFFLIDFRFILNQNLLPQICKIHWRINVAISLVFQVVKKTLTSLPLLLDRLNVFLCNLLNFVLFHEQKHLSERWTLIDILFNQFSDKPRQLFRVKTLNFLLIFCVKVRIELRLFY